MRKIYYNLTKNFKIKILYKNSEYQKKVANIIFKEFNKIPNITIFFLKYSYKLSLRYSKFRTICLLSNRIRGTLKYFMLSRMPLKKLALNGYIIGMKKASW